MMLRVLSAGMLTTVQDLGRFGYAHLGISPAGAADALSYRIANLLVGNDEKEPALEMTMTGVTLAFEDKTVLSITGATVLGKGSLPLHMWNAVEIPAGGVLECGQLMQGARAYLAVQGGIHVPMRMGSASTHLASRVGGWEGRALRSGDVLACGASPHGPARELKPGIVGKLKGEGSIRVTRGIQWDWLETHQAESFLTAKYMVSDQSNRSGLRLSGKAVLPKKHDQLLTEGVSLGAIQIPPDGQPIILFVDQQTTGGYPKVANVIAADMNRIGQLRPRDELSFELVSIEQAVQHLQEQEEILREGFTG
jgi:antagonist of KipI